MEQFTNKQQWLYSVLRAWEHKLPYTGELLYIIQIKNPNELCGVHGLNLAIYLCVPAWTNKRNLIRKRNRKHKHKRKHKSNRKRERERKRKRRVIIHIGMNMKLILNKWKKKHKSKKE